MNTPLFRRDLVVAALSSGSKGNCTYIGDERAGVLVDCGPSTKQIHARMDAVGLGGARIAGVLITHEHDDHVGAARVLSASLASRQGAPVPFFMTEGTRSGLRESNLPDAIELVEAGGSVQLGALTAESFSVPHDTHDPVGWRVALGGTWAGVVTDLGKPTALVLERLRSLTVAVLEFNHDEAMLMEGSYPWHLKQRIRGNKGHLSNEQAALLLEQGVHEGLQHLVLAHLSEENNSPRHALGAAMGALRAAGAIGKVDVQVALQREPLPAIRVATAGW